MAETEAQVNPQLSGGGDKESTVNEDQNMPDARKPSDSSSDSDSDTDSGSDSDSENDAQTLAQIQALETALQSNPSDYDSHAQYIKILRKLGDIEKVRQAREAMSLLFPMTPEMWQEWIKDEITCFGEDAFAAVQKLYERGVSDYLSVSLWCDYLNFVQEHDSMVRECSAAGISKARNLFERALTAAGLHVAEGHKIWELYTEFEQAIFLTIEESDSGSKEKQIQLIRNLFNRQLSVPLAEHKSILLAYKAWEANHGTSVDVNSSELDGLPSNAVSVYQKAVGMLNARAHLEEQISKIKDGPEKLQEFMTYLKFEHSFGDPARIQILYERAIAEFPISSDLWLDYTQYLDKTFKTARIVRDAYHRATRNCPWVGELWVRYLLSMERGRSSEEELATVFEKSLQCIFSSFDEYLNIYLTRVDGLRRRVSASTKLEDGGNYSVIRETFQRASDYLSPHIKNTESFLRMHSYWARLELKARGDFTAAQGDFTAARGVWESLLKISGSVLETWQCYIAMEIDMGQINEARSLYKRCYSKRFPGTGSEDICHAWVRFERENGSLEEFDIAVQKVTPRLQELQLFRLQQESLTSVVVPDEKENSSKKNAREKRKPTASSIDEQAPAKRRKDTAQDIKKTKENDKGQVKSPVKASEATESHPKPVESISTETKDTSSTKSLLFDDQCTAFVSNLNLKTSENDLRKFLADVGGVVAIRILKDKFTNKSRGLAYVDFSDDAHLTSALEKNKQYFQGKKLSILKSNPKQQGRKKTVAGPSISSKDGKSGSDEALKGRGDASKPGSLKIRERIELKGSNTFAVPRNVKPLAKSSSIAPPGATTEQGDEIPKSNDEFRKMLLKEPQSERANQQGDEIPKSND